VITFKEHVLPLIDTLARHFENAAQ
jgi:hypothetical protein